MGTDLWQQTVTLAVEGVPVPKARVLRSDQAYDEVRARAPGPARCRKQAAAITGEIAPQKNSSQNWAQRSCAQSSRSTGSSHTPTTSGTTSRYLRTIPRQSSRRPRGRSRRSVFCASNSWRARNESSDSLSRRANSLQEAPHA